MHKMASSPEQDNFVKLSFILLDVVARYLREYFVRHWDQKYPDEKWHGDVEKKNERLKSLLVTPKGKPKKDRYSINILKTNETDWDISTLVHALLFSNFNLVEDCRDEGKRTTPLLDSEEIDIIREIRNSDYGHKSSPSCSFDEFFDIMKRIKSAAKNLFGEDAEKEIYKIEMSSVTTDMRAQVDKLVEVKSEINVQPASTAIIGDGGIINIHHNYYGSAQTRIDGKDINPSLEAQLIGRMWRLRSSNYPDFLVRHQNSRVKIDKKEDSNLYHLDSSWKIVKGLCGNGISLQSNNYPKCYLRHSSYQARIDEYEDSNLFKRDSSFIPHKGLANIEYYSFESFNYRGYYLRHCNYFLRIDRDDGTELFKQDATFEAENY